jgi:two-component system phosphate regulon response regulator OmpR
MTETDRKSILICDDEAVLREMVCEYLTERGFQADGAADASEMHQMLERKSFDLVILDINMPGEDGLSALRTIRSSSNLPVLMMTAASGVIDRVVGLEMGADDYLGKPVDLRELEARIKAALRRAPGASNLADANGGLTGRVAFGPCLLDVDGARLFGPDGDEIAITAMEFSLLRVFAQNRGRVLNRDQLLDQAHDREWEPFDRSIDLRISRLRRKIEPHSKKPDVIRTVRGVGYVFDQAS